MMFPIAEIVDDAKQILSAGGSVGIKGFSVEEIRELTSWMKEQVNEGARRRAQIHGNIEGIIP